MTPGPTDGRRQRPAALAARLDGPPPETHFAPDLAVLCHHGERAVTVAALPGSETVAVLGSPFDPEAFQTWRANGIQIFFRGPAPTRLELLLDATANVAAVVTYDPDIDLTEETQA